MFAPIKTGRYSSSAAAFPSSECHSYYTKLIARINSNQPKGKLQNAQTENIKSDHCDLSSSGGPSSRLTYRNTGPNSKTKITPQRNVTHVQKLRGKILCPK